MLKSEMLESDMLKSEMLEPVETCMRSAHGCGDRSRLRGLAV